MAFKFLCSPKISKTKSPRVHIERQKLSLIHVISPKIKTRIFGLFFLPVALFFYCLNFLYLGGISKKGETLFPFKQDEIASIISYHSIVYHLQKEIMVVSQKMIEQEGPGINSPTKQLLSQKYYLKQPIQNCSQHLQNS